MIARKIIDDIKSFLLQDAQEDYVGLWAVLWEVMHACPSLDSQSAKQATLMIIRESLEADGVVPGEFMNKTFVPWNLTTGQALDRIERAWASLGRAPNIGEIVWFVASSVLTSTRREE